MKIALDVAQTCQERAGCAWYADSLATAMMTHFPENEYILYHQFSSWHNEKTGKGTIPIGQNTQAPFLNTNSAQSHARWANISQTGQLPESPDIIHSTSFQAPKFNNSKLIFTVYDLSFWIVPEYTTEANRLACQTGMLAALKNADGLAFISNSTQQEFERIFPGWLSQKGIPWAVTPLGARKPPAKTSQFPFGKYNLIPQCYWLSLGSLEPRKNINTLLDAHETYLNASKHKYPLVIAGGSGWKSNKLKKRIALLAEKGCVIPVGYVPDEQLSSIYNESAGLVFTSLYEGFGLPILEAFINRCPVITGKHTSLSEVAEAACLEIDPRNNISIANAMISLEDTKELRKSLINKGITQSEKFSWNETARLTLDLYNKVLNRATTA